MRFGQSSAKQYLQSTISCGKGRWHSICIQHSGISRLRKRSVHNQRDDDVASIRIARGRADNCIDACDVVLLQLAGRAGVVVGQADAVL